MGHIKSFFLFLMLIGFTCLSAQKNTQKDTWSGTYALNTVYKGISTTVDTLVISRIEDAKSRENPAKEKSNAVRWSMISKRDGGKDKVNVEQFLFDAENDKDAYKEFGWTDLHKAGKMNCIDGGNFFICQTLPNTTVAFGIEENYLTKTGIFGIWLHYGIVELQKK